MSIDLGFYLFFLAIIYYYPNRQGSVGYLWACCYVPLQWFIDVKLGANGLVATTIAALSLLLTFEISRFLWEEPFSLANVIQVLRFLLGRGVRLLAIFGLKPSAKLLDHKNMKQVIEVSNNLKNGCWDDAEDLLNQMDANIRYRVIKALADIKCRPNEFDQWLEARPESAMAYIVSGHHLIQWAWEARGSGIGSTVTKKGAKLYYERLFQAREELETAIEIKNQYADPYVGLITVAMGTGFARELLWEYFAKALSLSPRHYEAHTVMINALAEKWGGDDGEMFSVAYKATADLPDGDPLVGIIPVAHIENWLYLSMCNLDIQAERYFKTQKVRNELAHAYNKISRCQLDTMEHIDALNNFAFCFYMAGMNTVSKEIIAKLGGDFVEYPWIYCSKPFISLFNTAYAVDHVLNELNKSNTDESGLDNEDDGAQDSDIPFSPEGQLDQFNHLDDTGYAALILHNDDINGFMYVKNMLEDIFEYDTLKSLWLLFHVSIRDKYVIWQGPTKEAKFIANEIIERGPDPSKINDGAAPLLVSIDLVD